MRGENNLLYLIFQGGSLYRGEGQKSLENERFLQRNKVVDFLSKSTTLFEKNYILIEFFL